MVGLLLKLCEICGPVKRNSIAVMCENWVKFKFEIAVSLLANMYITMDRNARIAMEVFQKCPGLRSNRHSVFMTLCYAMGAIDATI